MKRAKPRVRLLRVARPSKLPKTLRGGYFEWLFQARPELRKAYQQAQARFGSVAGIYGIGIGRRFLEQDGRYAPAGSDKADYCLKVFVRRKRKFGELKKSDRIPRWIMVRGRARARPIKVELDVVTVLSRQGKGRGGRLNSGARGWPTAGRIDMGHLFAFTKQPVPDGPLPSGFPPTAVELGTIGALVRSADGADLHAVSASHVFINLCANVTQAPNDNRALGVSQVRWELLPAGSFRPLSVQINSDLRDALAFRIPEGIRPQPPHWPDGFTGELASQEDIDRAIRAETASGFIWVERRGLPRPRMIPIDLEAIVDPVVLPVQYNGSELEMSFIQTWKLRFIPGPDRPEDEQSTMGGDSGAGVFLWAENNSDCRLLGFHFYESEDQTQSYAADARWFLKQAFGDGFGADYLLSI